MSFKTIIRSNPTRSQLQTSVLLKDHETLCGLISSKDMDLNNRCFSMTLKEEMIFGLTALQVSVIINDLNAAKVLLESGADVNAMSGQVWTTLNFGSDEYRDQRRYSSLHMAVIKESSEMCQLLVDFKADINAKDHRMRTPLELSLQSESIFKLLVKKGANVYEPHYEKYPLIFRAISQKNIEIIEFLGRFQTRCQYYCNQSAIEYAMKAFPECVSTLISFGRHLHSPNPSTGETLLHLAIRKMNMKWIEELCEFSCDPNLANWSGNRSLHIAVQSKCCPKIVLTLLSFGANPNLKNTCNGLTPISFAIESGNSELIELFLRYNSRLSPRMSELQKAIQFRKQKVTLILLKNCKPFDKSFTFDCDPVLWFYVKHCLRDNDSDVMEMTKVMQRLIDLSPDINSIDSLWGTLLHFLIYVNVCLPSQCYKHLFNTLILSPKCDINKVFYPKDIHTKTGEVVAAERIVANGTGLSFALELKDCDYFAEQLIRMGADLSSINWDHVFFAPNKVKALKMLVLSGCHIPDWFEEDSNPLLDESVAEEDLEFYSSEFNAFNQWHRKCQTNPFSLKQISRKTIRNCLGRDGCRRLETDGARVFGEDLELPTELCQFIRFKSQEDFD